MMAVLLGKRKLQKANEHERERERKVAVCEGERCDWVS